MNNDIKLNELWLNQETKPPQIEALLLQFAKVKRNGLLTLIIANILMAITMAWIIFIWVYFNPKLISTKMGMVICIFAIIVYLIFYNRLLPQLRKANETLNNRAFLKKVIELKDMERFLQTKLLAIYFLTLTIGLCLYLYEYIILFPLPWPILIYSGLLAWVAFNWFYVRPKIVQRKENRLAVLINKLNTIKSQYQ